MDSALLSRHGDDQLVAFGAAGERTAGQLLHDAAIIAAALPELCDHDGQLLFVLRGDRYLVAAALLAAQARGQRVAIVPELGRDAITEVAGRPETATIVHDTASGVPLSLEKLLRQSDASGIAPLSRDALARAAPRIHVYERDRQGALVPGEQGVSLFGAALAMAARLDGSLRFASTLSPEQPFDLAMAVLVPLLSGGAFARERWRPDEELAQRLSEARTDVLISVPHALRKLAQTVVPGGLRRILSCVRPLPATLASALVRNLGCEISDLAPRQSDDDGHIDTVSGPLSLQAIEEQCLSLDGVADASVLALHDDDGRRTRVLLAFVGEPSPMALTTAIKQRFELRIAAEDVLRLSRIRRKSTGEVERVELLRAFRLRPDGSPVSFALRWNDARKEPSAPGERHVRQVHVPADYGYFDGHFPGYPILPGAAQLSEIVLPSVRRANPRLGALVQMSRLKFSGRIQPDQTIDVVLQLRSDGINVDFELWREKSLCSAGTLTFAAPGAP